MLLSLTLFFSRAILTIFDSLPQLILLCCFFTKQHFMGGIVYFSDKSILIAVFYIFRLQYRVNGRSSSPTSLGSYGVEDDDGFLAHDHDSDTGVVSSNHVLKCFFLQHFLYVLHYDCITVEVFILHFEIVHVVKYLETALVSKLPFQPFPYLTSASASGIQNFLIFSPQTDLSG